MSQVSAQAFARRLQAAAKCDDKLRQFKEARQAEDRLCTELKARTVVGEPSTYFMNNDGWKAAIARVYETARALRLCLEAWKDHGEVLSDEEKALLEDSYFKIVSK